jgi:simple sugar transport system permease protein
MSAWTRIRDGGIELLLSVVVTAVALVIALLFVLAAGVPLGSGISAFLTGAFGTEFNVANTLAAMVPLTLVALGWIVAFRAGRFHVGFPGQILAGSLLVSVVALKVSLPIWLHLPLTVLAGMVGGAVWAGIAALLWAKRGVNEILSTLLLNLVAIQVLAWWVRGPFNDPTAALPLTPTFPESSRWPILLTNTNLCWDIVLLGSVVAIAFLLSKTSFGFQVRVVGANSEAARHSGMSPQRVGTRAMLLSGALAGLAGSSLVLASPSNVMGENPGSALGYTGIAVALVARNSPWGAIPAALLFASLVQGSAQMEATVGVSSALVDVVQGLMVILVLGATTLLYYARRDRLPRISRPRRRDAARPDPELEVVSR